MKFENQELIDEVDKISKEISSTKRSNHHRDKFFPMLIDRLNLKKGIEIGVDKAGFSSHILEKSKIEKYYCVDTWQDNFGSDYKPDYFDKDGSKRYNDAQATLLKYIQEERAVMLKMTGMEASTQFSANSLDFCYIDGDHSLEGIYSDLKAWVPIVRIGGIIAGHDYKDGPKSGINDYFGNQLDYKIKTVVDYYCSRYGYKLNTVGGRIISWWFVKNRNHEDHIKLYLLKEQ